MEVGAPRSNMNRHLILGIGVLGLSLLVDIIGTAIPYWWVISAKDFSLKYGLFQQCATYQSVSECASYTTVTGSWMSVQAMMILSILALAAAVGLAVLFGCFSMKDPHFFRQFSVVMAATGAGLASFGVGIFGLRMDLNRHFKSGGLHAGFVLAIGAVILAIVGAMLVKLSK